MTEKGGRGVAQSHRRGDTEAGRGRDRAEGRDRRQAGPVRRDRCGEERGYMKVGIRRRGRGRRGIAPLG